MALAPLGRRRDLGGDRRALDRRPGARLQAVALLAEPPDVHALARLLDLERPAHRRNAFAKGVAAEVREGLGVALVHLPFERPIRRAERREVRDAVVEAGALAVADQVLDLLGLELATERETA